MSITHNKKYTRLLILAVATLLLAGCIIRPYKITIHQGNYIKDCQVEAVRPGMRPQEVQAIMGTPLLDDAFHTNRWDYVFYKKPARKAPEKKHVVVFFENGRVASVHEEAFPCFEACEIPCETTCKPACKTGC